jgi:hypothetical protein
VGMTIRECIVFLYEQWHELSRQRYLAAKREIVTKGIIAEPMELEQNGNQNYTSPEEGAVAL